MENVIPLSLAKRAGKDNTDYTQRVLDALRNLPREEKERLVRIFELMALSMEIELMERTGDPGPRR